MLIGFWLLWPGPTVDPRGARQTGFDAHEAVTAAEAGLGVSVKRQLVGEAMAARDALERRLQQIAATVSPIGIPNPPAVDAATVSPDVPAAAAFILGEAAPGPGSSEIASAPTATESSGRPAPDQIPEARADAIAEVSTESGGGTAILRTAAAATVQPAVAADRSETTAVAHLMSPDRVPRRGPTWLQNAIAPAIDHRPAIAIVIDDLGVSRKATEAVTRLKAPLTLSFLPYAPSLPEQTRAARAAGHELLVHVPMEPIGPAWPGPEALLSSLVPAELVARLRSQLHTFRGFVGINNHMGSLLTADHERMALVMTELRRQDLLFLDSRTTPKSVAADEAARLGVPHAVRDVFLDDPFVAIGRQFARVEEIAAKSGLAVAIGHPRDQTIEALRQWLPTLEAKGFALVPISTVVARRACADGVLTMAEVCARYGTIASLMR